MKHFLNDVIRSIESKSEALDLMSLLTGQRWYNITALDNEDFITSNILYVFEKQTLSDKFSKKRVLSVYNSDKINQTNWEYKNDTKILIIDEIGFDVHYYLLPNNINILHLKQISGNKEYYFSKENLDGKRISDFTSPKHHSNTPKVQEETTTEKTSPPPSENNYNDTPKQLDSSKSNNNYLYFAIPALIIIIIIFMSGPKKPIYYTNGQNSSNFSNKISDLKDIANNIPITDNSNYYLAKEKSNDLSATYLWIVIKDSSKPHNVKESKIKEYSWQIAKKRERYKSVYIFFITNENDLQSNIASSIYKLEDNRMEIILHSNKN